MEITKVYKEIVEELQSLERKAVLKTMTQIVINWSQSGVGCTSDGGIFR